MPTPGDPRSEKALVLPSLAEAREDARRTLRALLAAAMAFGVVVNVALIALPLYSMQVFDRVLSSRSVETLIALTAVTLWILGVQAALDHVRALTLRRGAARLGARLCAPLLRRALADAAEGDTSAAGRLRDLREARTALASPALCALADLPMTPLFVAVVFLIHPLLGAFVLLALAALGALAAAHVLASRRPAEARERRGGEADLLRNAEAVRALGMAEPVLRRWTTREIEALGAESALARRTGAVLTATKFTRMAVQVGIIGLGAALVLDGAMTPGAMIAGSLLMARALSPVEQAIGGWRTLSTGLAAARRLGEALASAEAAEPAPTRISLPTPAGRLETRALVHRPVGAREPVLRGVTLSLDAGHVLAVVGPSGSGKSTLMRLLAGLGQPSAGEIRLDGADLAQYGADLGPLVGYLPQAVQLLPGGVGENIARFHEDARSEDVVAAARLAGVHDLIVGLPQGYETPIGEGGHVLSGGQQQRIGLARALYGDPRLVLLDEPNAHLDPEGEAALVSALGALKERGRTVVLVSHRASLLRCVDWILVLREGRVERAGPRGELMRALADAPAPAPGRIVARAAS